MVSVYFTGLTDSYSEGTFLWYRSGLGVTSPTYYSSWSTFNDALNALSSQPDSGANADNVLMDRD